MFDIAAPTIMQHLRTAVRNLLAERVAELEAQIDPDPTGKSYDAMSRDERVRKIRETLLEDAQRRHSGKA